jgi:hypothetical protein
MCKEVIPDEFWRSLGQYVYAYIINGIPIYIGKGNRDRARQHVKNKNYSLDDLYILARNLENFEVQKKQDWQAFLLESYLISIHNPTDNKVSGHYKECFKMAKFSELFTEYKSNQNDNFEALPEWYVSNYAKFKGRLNVIEIKSDQIILTAVTREQIQPSIWVSSKGEIKSFRFTIWTDADKAQFRRAQLEKFLDSCGIEAEYLVKTGNREIYEVQKELTVDDVINIFEDFMS